MNLHFIRHAKTNQESKTGQDIDRELLPRGHAQAKDLSNFLREKKIGNADIWVSIARRTQQTFDYLKESFDSGFEVQHQPDLYLCSRDILLKKIWNNPSDKEIVIVGHNFGLSDLLSYFLDDSQILKTGEYRHLKFDCDSWAETSRGLAIQADRYRSKA